MGWSDRLAPKLDARWWCLAAILVLPSSPVNGHVDLDWVSIEFNLFFTVISKIKYT